MNNRSVAVCLFGMFFGGVVSGFLGQALAAESEIPGFVSGEKNPETDPPAVRYKDGWLVPYEETIPGTDVTFRMVPIPAGSFLLGSPDDEVGREENELSLIHI